ncbi:MAG: hypothetical protein QXR89_01710 [Candidatus Bathyarchaeia archaeon]
MFEEYMILMFIATLLIGLGMCLLIWVFVRAPAISLQSKFKKLGVVKGKRKEEIIAVVGPPNSISMTPNGELLQWISPGYHIALLFDSNGVCLGITHETAV